MLKIYELQFHSYKIRVRTHNDEEKKKKQTSSKEKKSIFILLHTNTHTHTCNVRNTQFAPQYFVYMLVCFNLTAHIYIRVCLFWLKTSSNHKIFVLCLLDESIFHVASSRSCRSRLYTMEE